MIQFRWCDIMDVLLDRNLILKANEAEKHLCIRYSQQHAQVCRRDSPRVPPAGCTRRSMLLSNMAAVMEELWAFTLNHQLRGSCSHPGVSQATWRQSTEIPANRYQGYMSTHDHMRRPRPLLMEVILWTTTALAMIGPELEPTGECSQAQPTEAVI